MRDLINQSLYLNPEDTEACVNYWSKLHFLNGIGDEKDRTLCAVSYTLMAQYMYGEEEPPLQTAVFGVSLEYLLLPIITKVIKSTKKPLVDAKSFFWYCKDFIRDRADHYEKVRGILFDLRIDIEAELSEEIANNVIDIINASDETEEK